MSFSPLDCGRFSPAVTPAPEYMGNDISFGLRMVISSPLSELNTLLMICLSVRLYNASGYFPEPNRAVSTKKHHKDYLKLSMAEIAEYS